MARFTKKQIDDMIAGSVSKLADETDAMRQHETVQTMLLAAAYNRKYSPFNQFMIWAQGGRGPVRTYNQWLALGRQVRKGERSHISLLRPIKAMREDADSGDKYAVTAGFTGFPVFDFSQTDGEPLPDYLLPADSGDATAPLAMLDHAARALGITVSTVDALPRGAFGMSSPGANIALVSSLSPVQRVHTLAHEIAHEILHQRPAGGMAIASAVKEWQVTAVAETICTFYGVRGKDSAVYTALWGAEGRDIRDQLATVQYAVGVILAAAEGLAASGVEDLDIAAD